MALFLPPSGLPSYAQDDPPCAFNARYPWPLYEQCAEFVAEYPATTGMLPLGAMTFGPDGSLYAARPATREIVRFKADGSEWIPAPYGKPEVFAADLPEPTMGLTHYDGAWYVSTDTMIWRLMDSDKDGFAEKRDVLVRDLPGGRGGWLGNIRVGPDRRLYTAKAASCDACEESDPRRGVLLSIALDGSDAKIVARGLRESFDFGWNPADGTLYIIDTERDGFPPELNAIPANSTLPLDFGWPRCDSRKASAQSADSCKGVTAPVFTFPVNSRPMGMLFYRGEAFKRFYSGGLLVALAGSFTSAEFSGYSVDMIRFDAQQRPISVERVLPPPSETRADNQAAAFAQMGFFPDRPLALAEDSRGWLYISTYNGRIIRLRRRPNCSACKW